MVRVVEEITDYATRAPCKTAAEMEELCCAKKDKLQCCEEVVPNWEGHSVTEALDHLGISLDDAGRDAAGDYVSIEFIPRTKPCGEKVTDYDTSPTNCCEEVAEISIDKDMSVEVLQAGESALVYLTGGTGTYTWSTSNRETFFSNKRRSMVAGSNISLGSTEDFCGATRVSVSDGCTTDSYMVRSSEGQWVGITREQFLSETGEDPADHEVSDDEWELALRRAIVYYGDYRVIELTGMQQLSVLVSSISCISEKTCGCYACVGDEVTCPGGIVRKNALVAAGSISLPVMLYHGSLYGFVCTTPGAGPQSGQMQSLCGFDGVAVWGPYTVANFCVNLDNVFKYLVAAGITYQKWVC